MGGEKVGGANGARSSGGEGRVCPPAEKLSGASFARRLVSGPPCLDGRVRVYSLFPNMSAELAVFAIAAAALQRLCRHPRGQAVFATFTFCLAQHDRERKK